LEKNWPGEKFLGGQARPKYRRPFIRVQLFREMGDFPDCHFSLFSVKNRQSKIFGWKAFSPNPTELFI